MVVCFRFWINENLRLKTSFVRGISNLSNFNLYYNNKSNNHYFFYTIEFVDVIILLFELNLCFDYEIWKYHNTVQYIQFIVVSNGKSHSILPWRIKMRQCDDKWSDFVMNENIEKKKPRWFFPNLNNNRHMFFIFHFFN